LCGIRRRRELELATLALAQLFQLAQATVNLAGQALLIARETLEALLLIAADDREGDGCADLARVDCGEPFLPAADCLLVGILIIRFGAHQNFRKPKLFLFGGSRRVYVPKP
jgi:hypothetical protein